MLTDVDDGIGDEGVKVDVDELGNPTV
ncbi:hypothetical protein E27107_310019 [Elizabethkingia anophelis]|nr:hypothetical protein E27107_310019 [Elizabethkingia anophelis]